MMSRNEIRSLTGIRGLAACLVMLYHVGSAQYGGSLGANGYLAVDLFFILSGFVMALTYARNFETAPLAPALGNFLLKRVARIYPLYIFMTVFMALLDFAGRAEPAHEFPYHVVMANGVMMQAWAIGQSLDTVSWSISTEYAAYLLFPLLVMLPLRGKASVQILVAALCVALVGMISLLPTEALHTSIYGGLKRHGPLDVSDGGTPWPLLRCLAEFLLGMLVWRATRSAWVRRAATGTVTTAAVVITFALWCVRGTDVALVIAFAVMVSLLAFDRGVAARALGSDIPHALGEWSYAIYLIHPAVMVMLVPISNRLTALHVPHAWSVSVCLALPATVAISWFAHHTLEKPARAWITQVFARPALT